MNSQGKIYYFLICQESKASTPWGEWKEKSRPAAAERAPGTSE